MVMRRSLIVLASSIAFATCLSSPAAASCGSNLPYIGQVCTFAFDFCPKGFIPADGRVLPIIQHQALFALFGTTYGGDGITTFAVPDLRGRTVVGTNDSRRLGETAGDATTVDARGATSSGGVHVPATRSPFVGLTRCVVYAAGVFPPRP
jgi:hypothetical protein